MGLHKKKLLKKLYFSTYRFFLVFLKILETHIVEITKNINPINLELGHIASDLKVGDRNIVKESNNNIFFSTLSNFNTQTFVKINY